MNLIRNVILVRGLFVSSIIGMTASISAKNHESIQQQWFFEFLTREELAVVAGSQHLEKDVINLIHEHMRTELAAGKAREEILVGIKGVIDNAAGVALTNTEKAMLIGVGVASLVGGVYLAKFILDRSASPAVGNLKPKPHHGESIHAKPNVEMPLNVKPGVVVKPNDEIEPDLNDEDDIKSESSAGFSDEELDLLVKPSSAKRPRRFR